MYLDHPPESMSAAVMMVKDDGKGQEEEEKLLRGARTKVGLAPEILWIQFQGPLPRFLSSFSGCALEVSGMKEKL